MPVELSQGALSRVLRGGRRFVRAAASSVGAACGQRQRERGAASGKGVVGVARQRELAPGRLVLSVAEEAAVQIYEQNFYYTLQNEDATKCVF